MNVLVLFVETESGTSTAVTHIQVQVHERKVKIPEGNKTPENFFSFITHLQKRVSVYGLSPKLCRSFITHFQKRVGVLLLNLRKVFEL